MLKFSLVSFSHVASVLDLETLWKKMKPSCLNGCKKVQCSPCYDCISKRILKRTKLKIQPSSEEQNSTFDFSNYDIIKELLTPIILKN